MLKVTVKTVVPAFTLDLNLEIHPSFTALFGPSGAGKTTTLNLIAGLIQPSQGEVVLDDRVLFSKVESVDISPHKRNIGYIFQESRLFPHLTVKGNLEFGFSRIPAERRRFDLDEIVSIMGLGGLLSRMPADLSGGEKQRVALGRALLAAPDYLLMDEPLAALDQTVTLSFLSFLRQVHERFDLPILYVSHDLANVLNFAEQVIVLQKGRCVAQGPPYSVIDKMAAPPLVSRQDISNILEVTIKSHDASTGVTTAGTEDLSFTLPYLDSPIGEKMLLNIPASEIILAIEEPKSLSASNVLPGRLARLHYLGERILAEIQAGEIFTVEIVAATVERLDLRVDKELFLIIKASSFRRLS